MNRILQVVGFCTVLVLGFGVSVALAAIEKENSVSAIVAAPQEGQAVSLQGKLVKQNEQGSLLLKDATGEIQVKISPELMNPDATQEGSTVEILGVVKTKGKVTPQVEVGAMTVRKTFVIEETVSPEKTEEENPQ